MSIKACSFQPKEFGHLNCYI